MPVIIPASRGRGVFPTGFTPKNVPNCELYLNSAKPSTMWQDVARTIPVTADGDSVARWDDLSGNSVVVNQAVAANRPTYKAGGYLYYDGNDSVYAALTVPGNQIWSMIVRFSDLDEVADNSFTIVQTTTSTEAMKFWPLKWAARRAYETGGQENDINPGKVLTGVMALAGVNCYLDAVPDGVCAAGSVADAPGIRIGGFGGGLGVGNIHHFAMYSRVITQEEVIMLTAWMNAN